MQEQSKTPTQKNKTTKNRSVSKKVVKKKKKKKSSGGAIFSILLLVIIIVVVAVLYFDVAGSKQILAQVLELDKPTEEQLAELETRRLDVVAKEEEQNGIIFTNNKVTKELEEKEAALTKIEEQQSKKKKELEDLQNEVDLENKEFSATVTMFEMMDAEKAAKAIDQMGDADAITKLLTHMDSEKASEVLNFMDYKIAAEVLSLILIDEVPPAE
ncbi:MAG: hypothetical protein KAQ68_04655 [Clostridiales bacterium]|nr:hypothetical protein [Clostridiales bacterium]